MSKKVLYTLSFLIPLMISGCEKSYKKEYEELKQENKILQENFEALNIKLLADIEALNVKSLEDAQGLRDSTQVLLDSINELKGLCFYYQHQSEIVKPSYWLSKYDIEALQKMGFENPQKEITADLRKNKYLFSGDAILGGIMEIDSAVLIGTDWMLASGGDGHIGLYYLFEYTVEENKKIKWKIIRKTSTF